MIKQAGDVFEIPDGSYSRDFPLLDDQDEGINTGDPSGLKNVYVPSAKPGAYRVTATGTGSGSFTIDFQTVNVSGLATTYSFTGVTSAGVQSNYDVGFPILATEVSINQAGSNSFTLNFATQESVQYAAEYKTSLTQSNWTTLHSLVGNGAIATVMDTNATGVTRFYRIRASP